MSISNSRRHHGGRLYRDPNDPRNVHGDETRRSCPPQPVDDFTILPGDLRVYRDLAYALYGQPSGHVCQYARCGQHLGFLNGQTYDWARVIQAANAAYPQMPTLGRIASDGRRLQTVPERLVYEALIRLAHRSGVAVDLHPLIAPDAGGRTRRLRRAARTPCCIRRGRGLLRL